MPLPQNIFLFSKIKIIIRGRTVSHFFKCPQRLGAQPLIMHKAKVHNNTDLINHPKIIFEQARFSNIPLLYCKQIFLNLISNICTQFSQVYWCKVLTILILLSTKLGEVKCDINRFLLFVNILGGRNQIYNGYIGENYDFLKQAHLLFKESAAALTIGLPAISNIRLIGAKLLFNYGQFLVPYPQECVFSGNPTFIFLIIFFHSHIPLGKWHTPPLLQSKLFARPKTSYPEN